MSEYHDKQEKKLKPIVYNHVNLNNKNYKELTISGKFIMFEHFQMLMRVHVKLMN